MLNFIVVFSFYASVLAASSSSSSSIEG